MRRSLLAAAVAATFLLGSSAASAQMQTWPAAQPGPPTQPPAQPAAPTYGADFQAGGLAPPPPMTDPNQNPNEVEQKLDKAKEDDAGRGLSWVYLEVEGGFEHVGLQTFNANDDFTAGLIETTASGGMIGAGLGARLLFLTLGVRGRLGFFSAWQLFSLGGELGLHFPIGNLEPRITLGAGYAALGSFSGVTSGATDAVQVHGFDARVGGGLDYYITPVFSVGAGATWEFLALTRPGLDPTSIAQVSGGTTPEQRRADALAADGSGYGSAIAVTAALGLHF